MPTLTTTPGITSTGALTIGSAPAATPPKTPAKSSLNDSALSANVSPTVITSAPAIKDVQKITSSTAEKNTAIQQQQAKVAQDKATADAAAQAKTTADAATKAASDKAASDAAALAIKNAALTGTTPPAPTIPSDSTFTNGISRATTEVKNVQNNLDGTRTVTYKDGSSQSIAGDPNDPVQAKATLDNTIKTEGARVSQQLLDIQSGAIPLSAGDQAQIEGLKKQWQDMIDSQVLTNAGASGSANVRGYQTGAAEYDPTFQVKTISAIVDSGKNKILDLQTKEAGAVATLTQALKDGDMKAIKDAYDIADTARKNSQTALADTVTKAQAAIKEAKDAQQKITDNVNTLGEDLKKAGAPDSVVNSVLGSKTVAEALQNSGDYLQTSSNPDIAKYLQYKKDTESKGLVPKDYATFQSEADATARKNKSAEAYDTAYNTAKGKAAGTVPGTTIDENGNVIVTGNMNALDIGRYNLAATRATKTFRDTQVFKAASNAGFYVSKIDAAVNNTGSIGDQEILDAISQFNTGGGRVTEAQVNLILSGKSLSDSVNAWTNKVKNGGVLSDNQREQALKLATATKDSFLKNYEEKYTPLAENLQKQGIPKEFWGIPSPEQLKNENAPDPKSQVDDYIKSNPTEAETIAKLYEVPGATDADIQNYLKAQGKLK